MQNMFLSVFLVVAATFTYILYAAGITYIFSYTDNKIIKNIFVFLPFILIIINLLVKLSFICYYLLKNIKIIQFIRSIPNETFIIYNDDEFYLKYLNEEFHDLTNHQKLEMLLKIEKPITERIPLNLKLKFSDFLKRHKKAAIIKRNDLLFLSNNLNFFKGNSMTSLNLPFIKTKSLNGWFNDFYKENKRF